MNAELLGWFYETVLLSYRILYTVEPRHTSLIRSIILRIRLKGNFTVRVLLSCPEYSNRFCSPYRCATGIVIHNIACDAV